MFAVQEPLLSVGWLVQVFALLHPCNGFGVLSVKPGHWDSTSLATIVKWTLFSVI